MIGEGACPGAVRDAAGRRDRSAQSGAESAELPPAGRDARSLHVLEAIPQMRGSRAFDAYIRVCETGEPWAHEVAHDTPFGDGYMRDLRPPHRQAR
jgi:hypothetical protein